MSHFSETLSGLMELEGHTQVELAELAGCDRPSISRYCNGHLVPTREMLARLVAAVSTDVTRRIHLLLAHLRDEAEAGSRGAGISPHDYVISPQSNESSPLLVVPFQLHAIFSILIEEASKSKRPELLDVLEGLSEMILSHRAELADAAAVNKSVALASDKLSTAPTGADLVAMEVARRQSPKTGRNGSPAKVRDDARVRRASQQ